MLHGLGGCDATDRQKSHRGKKKGKEMDPVCGGKKMKYVKSAGKKQVTASGKKGNMNAFMYGKPKKKKGR